MYAYDNRKNFDYVSDSIIRYKSWEMPLTLEMKNAIEYYAKKNNIIDNKNITIIDIGANIGCHTLSLAKLNYSIIGFEPSEKNYYTLRKSICLNNFTNVLIFNVGLYDKEKVCDYYEANKNYGNGMVLCNNNENGVLDYEFFKANRKIILTKLSNYYPYLFNKKIALVKIDIEGSEEKAIKSGIELISKYHIPFIVSEFTIRYLEKHGSDPKEFVRMFVNNGYMVSRYGFFGGYENLDRISRYIKNDCELFFVYKDYAK